MMSGWLLATSKYTQASVYKEINASCQTGNAHLLDTVENGTKKKKIGNLGPNFTELFSHSLSTAVKAISQVESDVEACVYQKRHDRLERLFPSQMAIFTSFSRVIYYIFDTKQTFLLGLMHAKQRTFQN